MYLILTLKEPFDTNLKELFRFYIKAIIYSIDMNLKNKLPRFIKVLKVNKLGQPISDISSKFIK